MSSDFGSRPILMPAVRRLLFHPKAFGALVLSLPARRTFTSSAAFLVSFDAMLPWAFKVILDVILAVILAAIFSSPFCISPAQARGTTAAMMVRALTRQKTACTMSHLLIHQLALSSHSSEEDYGQHCHSSKTGGKACALCLIHIAPHYDWLGLDDVLLQVYYAAILPDQGGL